MVFCVSKKNLILYLNSCDNSQFVPEGVSRKYAVRVEKLDSTSVLHLCFKVSVSVCVYVFTRIGRSVLKPPEVLRYSVG